MQFFAILGTAQQLAFLTEATAKVDAHLKDRVSFAQEQEAQGNKWESIVCRGACRVLQARLDWLHETARTLNLNLWSPVAIQCPPGT
ncbi:MAG: hypothetical protein HY040_06125 [Planctomycetes bacterium]|nr:hypothetical protein [Planctomycetota bacterium]